MIGEIEMHWEDGSYWAVKWVREAGSFFAQRWFPDDEDDIDRLFIETARRRSEHLQVPSSAPIGWGQRWCKHVAVANPRQEPDDHWIPARGQRRIGLRQSEEQLDGHPSLLQTNEGRAGVRPAIDQNRFGVWPTHVRAPGHKNPSSPDATMDNIV